MEFHSSKEKNEPGVIPVRELLPYQTSSSWMRQLSLTLFTEFVRDRVLTRQQYGDTCRICSSLQPLCATDLNHYCLIFTGAETGRAQVPTVLCSTAPSDRGLFPVRCSCPKISLKLFRTYFYL